MEEVRKNVLEAMQLILEANREETERRFHNNPKITREQLRLRAT